MKVTLQAIYIPTHFDLKRVRERFPKQCARLSDPLRMSLDEDKYAYITSFGTVVLWPFDKNAASRIIADLKPFIGHHRVVDEVTDQLVVATSMPESKVLFEEIWLAGEPSSDQVELISKLFAQSVALDYLGLEVDRALDRIEQQVIRLRKSGRLNISNKSVFKNVGFAMEIRHRVLMSLSLFDKPDAVWESENLETLYDELHNYFDIEDRHQTIARKLTLISDNTSFLYEFLSTRKGHQLEWIIIVLIAIEIFLSLFFELVLH